MGRKFGAARVFQNAKKSLDTALVKGQRRPNPTWLEALEHIPPTETLTRPYAFQHTAPNTKAKKPRNLYKPTQIVYPEDQLRKDFYRDHPWELARPRMILELDGLDARYRDWSKGLLQPGLPLCGESVVQRQLWLIENEGKSKEVAYDEVRRQFYRLRQEEEVERRIAQEEARMVGAYFGKNALQVGMEIESKQFDAWKKWAKGEVMRMEAEASKSYTSFGDETEAEAAPEEVAAPAPA